MNSLIDIFDVLNNHCNYTVLRNWECLQNESIYVSGHEDIDILCDSLEQFISATNAKRIHKENRRNNYIITCNNSIVRFDVRWVGDGYYPIEMEKSILSHKKRESYFYIPSDIDYFYSLAYHAFFQKPKLTEDYWIKLNKAYNQLNNDNNTLSEESLLDELFYYLGKNNISVEYPSDPGVFLNHEIIHRAHIRRALGRQVYRAYFINKEIIKHYVRRIFAAIIGKKS